MTKPKAKVRAGPEDESRTLIYDRTVVLSEPMPHQQEILLASERCKVAICGRRFGKTELGTIAALVGHGPDLTRKGALYGGQVWWVVPTFTLAVEVWDRLDFALRDVWVRRNAVERRFTLPGGGSLQVKSSDNPDALRGSGLDGVVIDEVKDHALKAWRESIRPALADKKGWLLAMGTPGPRDEGNLAFYLYARAAERRNWRRWQLPSSANPMITAGEVADMREELGPHAFAREVMAEFVADSGGMFSREWFRFYDVQSDERIALGRDRSVTFDELNRFATVDLAASVKTYSDWSVIASWGATRDGHLVLLDVRREKIEGAAILRALRAATERWALGAVWIESTAYHNMLISQAREEGLPVRELVAHKDKVTRAEPAAAALEGARVWFPRLATWLETWTSELLSFPDQGSHDDQVDTLSYAVAVLRARARIDEAVPRPAPTPVRGPLLEMRPLPSIRPVWRR